MLVSTSIKIKQANSANQIAMIRNDVITQRQGKIITLAHYYKSTQKYNMTTVYA
jgi:hypothetical protein